MTPRASARLAAVVLANVGIITATFAPITNLLPRKIAGLDLGHTQALTALAVVTGTGAAVALVANLLAGWLSDRFLIRLRGRRPWAVLGVLAGFVALALLAWQPTLPRLAIVWAAAQIGINFLIAPLAAFVPDQVPRDRRGQVSALIGLGQITGVVLAAALDAINQQSADDGLTLVAIAYLVLTAPAIAVVGAPVLGPPSHSATDELERPRRYADFGWAWLTRFIISLSGAVAILFLFYYLSEVLRVRDPTERQLVLVVITAIFVVLAAISGGRVSDLTGRRKPLLMASIGTLAIAQLILAAIPRWQATIGAAVLIGIGYGAFLAVDQALIADVLPRAPRYARDLSIMNIAIAAPQIIAPAVAAAFTSSRAGYVGLYGAAGLLTLTAAGFVRPIRSVR